MQVSADQRTDVAIELTPLPGTLALSSRVEGVEVWVGPDRLGETTAGGPLLRDNLPPGTYRVKAGKAGYAPWEQEVQVSADQRTDVAIELTPLPGWAGDHRARSRGGGVGGNDKLGETTAGGASCGTISRPAATAWSPKPAIAPWERQVQVSADQRTDVAIELTPLPREAWVGWRSPGAWPGQRCGWVQRGALGEYYRRAPGTPLSRDNLPAGGTIASESA